MTSDDEKDGGIRSRAGAETGRTLLEADSVSVQFGGLTALDDVTFHVYDGVTTGLIGPNGAGKTTLVNVLSGMIPPTTGSLRWHGEPPRQWRLGTACRAGVVRTFQRTRVFGQFSVLDNIKIAQLASRTTVDPDDVLTMLDLDHRRNTLAKLLPFGEGRRLGVAMALATDPEVLLLDEPAAGLTGTDITMLTDSIWRLTDQGKTVVVVDHNMRFVMQTVKRVVVLDGGREIAAGTPEDVQQHDEVIAAYLGRSSHAAGE